MMKLKKFNNPKLPVICIVIIMLVALPAGAEKMNLSDAINYGLDNNSSIQKQQQTLDSLEREREKNRAQANWQASINADYDFYQETVNDNQSLPEESIATDSDSLNIKLRREFSSGLVISPSLNLEIEEIEHTFNLGLEQQVLPRVPSDRERNDYRLEQEIIKAGDELQQEENDLIINWIEAYLELARLQESLNISRERLKLAEERLTETEEKERIGESGGSAILAARLEVKSREIELQEQKNNLNEKWDDFYRELDLPDETELEIDTRAEIISGLKERLDSEFDPDLAQEELWEKTRKNNLQLKGLSIDEKILIEELRWLKKDTGPVLNWSGNYNGQREEVTLGVTLSYNFYDSGQKELEIADKEDEIKAAGDNYTDFKQKLRLQLEQLLNRLQEAKLGLEQQELNLEKAALETEIARKQLQEGAIDDNDYQEQILNKGEAEINFARAGDRLFITELRLWQFTESDVLY